MPSAAAIWRLGCPGCPSVVVESLWEAVRAAGEEDIHPILSPPPGVVVQEVVVQMFLTWKKDHIKCLGLIAHADSVAADAAQTGVTLGCRNCYTRPGTEDWDWEAVHLGLSRVYPPPRSGGMVQISFQARLWMATDALRDDCRAQAAMTPARVQWITTVIRACWRRHNEFYSMAVVE